MNGRKNGKVKCGRFCIFFGFMYEDVVIFLSIFGGRSSSTVYIVPLIHLETKCNSEAEEAGVFEGRFTQYFRLLEAAAADVHLWLFIRFLQVLFGSRIVVDSSSSSPRLFNCSGRKLFKMKKNHYVLVAFR